MKFYIGDDNPKINTHVALPIFRNFIQLKISGVSLNRRHKGIKYKAQPHLNMYSQLFDRFICSGLKNVFHPPLLRMCCRNKNHKVVRH